MVVRRVMGMTRRRKKGRAWFECLAAGICGYDIIITEHDSMSVKRNEFNIDNSRFVQYEHLACAKLMVIRAGIRQRESIWPDLWSSAMLLFDVEYLATLGDGLQKEGWPVECSVLNMLYRNPSPNPTRYPHQPLQYTAQISQHATEKKRVRN